MKDLSLSHSLSLALTLSLSLALLRSPSLSLLLFLSYLDLKPITIPFPSNKEKVAPIWQVWGKKNTNEAVSQQNLSEREEKNVEQLERFHFLCLHLFFLFFPSFLEAGLKMCLSQMFGQKVFACCSFIRCHTGHSMTTTITSK